MNEKKYVIESWMKIDVEPSEVESLTMDEAIAEIKNMRLMQPEDIHEIVEVEAEVKVGK